MDPRSTVIFNRNLIFVSGKGGVGKTVISQAAALRLSQTGKRVLWVTFEDPLMPSQELLEIKPGLFHLNCEPSQSFEEYAALKIGVPGLARIFLQNKVMRYLAKASPGLHELVLLGKVWHERLNYDHVIVDMPSTGYGLAMFQSTRNFAKLFHGGPIHRDAESMLETFDNPKECGHLIVSLPEEMPLRESLELRDYLVEILPHNKPEFLVNRLFPALKNPEMTSSIDPRPDRWPTPVARDAQDYAAKRALLERFNLRIWEEESVEFLQIGYEPPQTGTSNSQLVETLARQFQARGYT